MSGILQFCQRHDSAVNVSVCGRKESNCGDMAQ